VHLTSDGGEKQQVVRLLVPDSSIEEWAFVIDLGVVEDAVELALDPAEARCALWGTELERGVPGCLVFFDTFREEDGSERIRPEIPIIKDGFKCIVGEGFTGGILGVNEDCLWI
jgi:hypothetical protein